MALDGIMLRSICKELNNKIIDSKINKIYQPEKDIIIINLHSNNTKKQLLLTSNAKFARISLTENKYDNPTTAPLFCMVLRKYLNGGRIININQPSLERIVEIEIETLNEFKDKVILKLIIEIMGKHSNIILVNNNGIIEDSIKHINNLVSSKRTVLPKIKYEYPPNIKYNPLIITKDKFIDLIKSNNELTINKSIFSSFTGISPLISNEIINKSNIDNNIEVKDLSNNNIEKIYNNFKYIIDKTLSRDFYNCVSYNNSNQPKDFYCFNLSIFNNTDFFKSPSTMIENFYIQKEKSDILKQKYSNIKRIITNFLNRYKKKKVLQLKSLESSKKAEIYKIKGELILSNMYNIKKGMKSIDVNNYYSDNNEIITIALDPNLTPSLNSQKYYNKYNKAKRTQSAVITQLKEVDENIVYFESLLSSLSTINNEKDIDDIKYELYLGKYIKKQSSKKNKNYKISKPLKFISSDGFTILVGKNNMQNDNVTFKIARSYDIWLHTKEIPGSHVIIKTDKKKIPETTLIEACMLSAHYSKAQGSSNIPVDYTERKNVKKPNGSKPGFVIYLSNKTKYVTPTDDIIKNIKQII